MSQEIKGFVTSLGATIIAYVKEETPEFYVLENALFLSAHQGQDGSISPQFSPVAVFASDVIQKGINCNLNKATVVVVHEIVKQLADHYSQSVGRIVVAPASSILAVK